MLKHTLLRTTLSTTIEKNKVCQVFQTPVHFLRDVRWSDLPVNQGRNTLRNRNEAKHVQELPCFGW